MLKLSDLLSERARVASTMRKLNDGADRDGALSADGQKKWDAMKSELESIEQRIQRQQLIDDLDRRMSGQTIHTPGDGEFEREKRNFSLCKAIASTFDHSVDAAREREICIEQRRLTGKAGDGLLIPFECLVPERRLEQRVLTVAGDGSNLVSTTVMGNEFVDALRPMSVATRLGARVLTGLVSDIALPKRDARTPTPAWFVEDAAIASGDQSFTQVTGSPKHLGLITEFGRKVMIQATPGIEAIVREHLMAELAIGLDLGVLKGSGASGQPTGITNTTGINTQSSASADPTWAQLLNVIGQVEAADVPMESLGFALNAHVKEKLRQILKVSADAGAGFLMDDGGRIDGHPSAITSQLDGDPVGSPTVDGESLFGNWAQVIVGMWGGLEILVNPFESTAYSKGNVSVRGIMDADVLVRHPSAFTHWTAIKVD